MAYAHSTVLPRSAIPKVAAPKVAAPKTASPAKRSFWSRVFEAIEQANLRRGEREIARYLGTHKFTDETEREIERRFLGS
ncbi:MAG TPA: hypothetical protein VFA57_15950 [Pseudolabrys sp.]|nr:hypothetical protein [Pseudolabrys sp.]